MGIPAFPITMSPILYLLKLVHPRDLAIHTTPVFPTTRTSHTMLPRSSRLPKVSEQDLCNLPFPIGVESTPEATLASSAMPPVLSNMVVSPQAFLLFGEKKSNLVVVG